MGGAPPLGDRGPLGRRPGDVAATAARGVGPGRRGTVGRPGPPPAGTRPGPGEPRCRGDARDARRAAGRGLPRPAGAEPDARPWSVVVGHDGVFKVLLLTLFDLPLERFWMWSFDLAGIVVIEIRGGRPLVRAMNLVDHLAPVLDEGAARRRPTNGAARGRSSRSRGSALAALPVAAPEEQPQQPDPQLRVRSADGLEPVVAEDPAGRRRPRPSRSRPSAARAGCRAGSRRGPSRTRRRSGSGAGRSQSAPRGGRSRSTPLRASTWPRGPRRQTRKASPTRRREQHSRDQR